MRYPAAEKLEIIRLVEQSRLPVRRTLDKLGVLPARFYRWDDRYQSGGYEALKDRPPRPKQVWNRIPDDVRGRVLRLALDAPELSPRELATRFIDTEGYFVSEASVYRLLKAHDLITSPAFVVIKAADAFKDKTVRPNQLWQTDFTYLKVIGWGWFYLSTILDDFSRYIIAWKLCTTMRTEDVTDTLELALKASGCDQAKVVHKPRLLSDNGSSYLSGDLAEWLDNQSMEHVRGAPSHPQTQGKIERWHQTLKNRILLENYYLPGDLEAQLGAFVEHYNHRRYHESLNNLTPADVYFGRGQTILLERERIKRKTIEHRRLQHRDAAGLPGRPDAGGRRPEQLQFQPLVRSQQRQRCAQLLDRGPVEDRSRLVAGEEERRHYRRCFDARGTGARPDREAARVHRPGNLHDGRHHRECPFQSAASPGPRRRAPITARSRISHLPAGPSGPRRWSATALKRGASLTLSGRRPSAASEGAGNPRQAQGGSSSSPGARATS